MEWFVQISERKLHNYHLVYSDYCLHLYIHNVSTDACFLSNSGVYTELQTKAFIWFTWGDDSNSINHYWILVLVGIPCYFYLESGLNLQPQEDSI